MAIDTDPPSIARALQLLQAGDVAAAETILVSLAGRTGADDPQVLHLMGMIRLRQYCFVEAAELFRRAQAADPALPQPVFGRGSALAGLGRDQEAIEYFQQAVRLKPDFVEAYYELGSALHRTANLASAAQAFRDLLQIMPAHVPAKLALGGVLIDAKRPVEAEEPLRAALGQPAPPPLKAALHTNLALALRRQRKDEEALENYDRAEALNPALPQLGLHRAEALQNLGRYDEAIGAYQSALAQEPLNPLLHSFYNDLLYRLNRTGEYLKSYDRVPKSRELQLGKASFLSSQGLGEEACTVYYELLAKNPDDRAAAVGVGRALILQKRYGEAAAAFDQVLARNGRDADLLRHAAEVALLRQDPQKALALCERGLAGARYDQDLLAVMSAGLRMMQDERDEALNGYDTLIQVFDLEPPQGFSSMDSFNAELDAYLGRLHPKTREYPGQSLRGGTQTPDHIFGAGHDLVERLQQRIAEAAGRYIVGLNGDENHPFLSRRTRGFHYAGSWSSRLTDRGFHVNHVHPDGWISSCYYVSVPDAAKDQQAKEGWIKFGEPAFDLKIPIRRCIQPVAGRLVLFPSYMWHGTIPFHSAAARTTIAFDAVPTG
jgi:tetratricopeptide (TPR) repeat protein